MARVLNDNMGNEVSLFPMDIMIMTQDIGGSFTHQGSYAMDIVGRNGYHDELYAPVTMKLVYIGDAATGNNRLWQSINKVNTPNGIDFIQLLIIHDDSPPFNAIGDVVNQGDLIARTGVSGEVTGDHSHLETKYGEYDGSFPLIKNQYDVWMLKDSTYPYEIFYVNDVTIINGYNHDWKKYDGGTTPPIIEKKKVLTPVIACSGLWGY